MAAPATKRTRLVFSSADRNLTTYPTPSDYVITFDEPIADVSSLALVGASLPLVAYQVSPFNRRIPFATNGAAYVAELPLGDYPDPQALAAAAAAAMDDACGAPERFTASFLPRTDNFTFASDQPFRFVFDGGRIPFGPQELDEFATVTSQGVVESMAIAGDQSLVSYAPDCAARILGFGPQIYASALDAGAQHRVTSPYRRDTSHSTSAVLRIDGADVNMSVNPTLNRSFAVFGPKLVDMEAWTHDRAAVKSFYPPLGKLARLRVRISDLGGRPYDFQNHDHRLEFIVTSTPRYQSRPNWTVRAD